MLAITPETTIDRINAVVRVYNGREIGSRIRYGDTVVHHELIFKFSGDSISRFGNKAYALSEGSVLYLPPGQHGEYTVETLRKGEAIDILFHSNTPLAQEPTLLPAPHKPMIGELFEKCHETWRIGPDTKQLKCLAHTYALLAEIADETQQQQIPAYMRAVVEPAMAYLDEHCFDADLDFTQLCHVTGASYSHLKKLFVARFGMPPSRYVIQKRMEYAKALLLAPETSVTSISRQLGYSSVYYFSRVFRRETGMTPTEYRSEM